MGNNASTQNSSIRRRPRFTMTESSLLRGCPSLALLLLSLLFCRSEFLHSFGFVSNPSTPRRSTGPNRPFSLSPSTHVPNLRESREVRLAGQKQQQHRPGDGSYRCQLYQVGAQKIIGFDFSASLTMD